MTLRHTYDLGIVGNCTYVAHVHRSARVVWLCLPRFDSSCLYGHLLDPERGGYLGVDAVDPSGEGTQEYVVNTNVLQTTVQARDGAYRVTDCAPRFEQYGRTYKPLILIRKLEPLGGSMPRIKLVCRPTGGYGEIAPKVFVQSNHVRYDLDADTVRLSTDVPVNYVLGERPFVLSEVHYVILTWGVRLEANIPDFAEDQLRRTIEYWQRWIQGCAIGRFYQRDVIRSALVLKLHQFEDTGAIIAASTTSLPEFPGSGRTWDYRYCWLRDAHFTLSAFNRIGQFDEMRRFAHFIQNIASAVTDGRLPPVVRLDGALELPESTVSLRGYEGSGPVRIGNAASTQVQNDIYGQIIYALLQLCIDERLPRDQRASTRGLISKLLAIIDGCLDEPDASLWEFRDMQSKHVYTALCHWLGAKSAAKIARKTDDHDLLRTATRLVVRSARVVETCYDAERRAYMQEPGGSNFDASALQLVTLNYLDPSSERAAHHVAAIERNLLAAGGLLHRYTHADDFGTPSAAFLICSFWYVEALAATGEIERALKELEVLFGYANHLGLFSEHVDPATGSQWGNFPQTYSHVGLINAVLRINGKIEYPEFY